MPCPRLRTIPAHREIAVCLCLLLAGFLASCGAEQRETAGGASATEQEAPPGSEGPPHAWMELAEPEPTPLTILPIGDTTGLKANWNFEIAELSRRLIPAWMAVGGEPVEVLDTWVLYPYLSQGSALGFRQETARSDEELRELGRQLNTARIVQVLLSRGENETIADAWLINVESGEREKEWTVSTECGENSYRAVFEVQAELASIVAADLLGITREELLTVPDVSQRLDPQEQAQVQEAIDTVSELLVSMTAPRVLEAYYLVADTLEVDPKNPQLWSLYTIIQRRLVTIVHKYETEIRREAKLRAILGGKIALALAPDDPIARFARGTSLTITGRRTESLEFSRQNAATYPHSWIDRLAYQVRHWEDDTELEVPETFDQPIEEMIFQYSYGFSRALRGEGSRQDILERWIDKDNFAPVFIHSLVGEVGDLRAGIGELRVSTHTMTLQGSMLTIMEAARQLDRHGYLEESREVLRQIYDITGGTMPDKHGSALLRQTREHLSNWFESSSGVSFALRSVGLPEHSPTWQLLLASRASREEAARILDDDASRPGPLGRTVSYTPLEGMEIAHRIAIQGALSVYEFQLRYLGMIEMGRELLLRLDAEFPNDLGVLNRVLDYYRFIHPNQYLIRETSNQILDVTPINVPVQRVGRRAHFSSEEEAIDGIGRVRYMEPFHQPSMHYVVASFADRRMYKQAYENAVLYARLDPLEYRPHYLAMLYKALKGGRTPEREEIAALEQYINPYDRESRLVMAEYYADLGFPGEAVKHFDQHRPANGGLSAHLSRKIAIAYQRVGRIEDAVSVLEQYASQPLNLQTGGRAIMKIHWIYLRQGNEQKAEEYFLKASDWDPWMGDFMRTQASWHQLKGELEQAEQAYHRYIRRYPDPRILALYARFLASTGRYEEAWDQVRLSFQMANENIEAQGVQMKFLIRDGHFQDAEHQAARRLDLHPNIVSVRLLLADYYIYTGRPEEALEHGYKALGRALAEYTYRARAELARAYLRLGKPEKALEYIKKNMLDYPDDMGTQISRAEALFQRGDMEAAEDALREALNYGSDRAKAIMGDILYERGDLEAALEQKRAANRLHLPVPHARWLYEEGRIAAELGREDEAREAWERVVELFGGEYHEFGSRAREGLEQLAGE